MNKKEFVLLGLVVVLGCLYSYFFTDWFAPKTIQIEHTARPSREAGNVTFALNRTFKLTSIQVVPLAEYETNQYAHPLWHLVSERGSDPAKAFAYGFPIAKMAPSVPGASPAPLVPGIKYRLIIEAGSHRGEHDFSVPVRAGIRR